MEQTANQFTAIEALPVSGVGRMNALGVETLGAALLYLPRGYTDYSQPLDAVPESSTGRVVVRVQVSGAPRVIKRTIPYRVELPVEDRHQSLTLVVFGNIYPWARMSVGDSIVVEVTPKTYENHLQLAAPVLVPASEVGRVVPDYEGKSGVITGHAIAEVIERALAGHVHEGVASIRAAFDAMPEETIAQRAGLNHEWLSELLYALHRPGTAYEGARALDDARRLAAYSVVFRVERMRERVPLPEAAIALDRAVVKSLVARLPYRLTAAQRRSIGEILRDLQSPFPMNRLLSGDVGSGKTAAYMIPVLAAHRAGARVAVLVPNTLIASQVAGDYAALYPEIPIRLVLADSKQGAIDHTGNPVFIGTTALFGALGDQWRAQFLVVDEQQKLSREQRGALAIAGTNVLEATATCIPKTGALVNHGAMDVSILNEMPVHKDIRTMIVDTQLKSRMFTYLKRIVGAGGQVAVIYPRVRAGAAGGEKDAASIKDVETAGVMWERVFPGRVGVLHGRMKGAGKEAVINKLKAGDYSVVVSSTVIEVGVHLPSLRAIVIVHPERYGVSVLHQMRGRVARTGGVGYCFLYLPEDIPDESRDRLELLVKHSDGFILAEKDMDVRGFGDPADDSGRQWGASQTLFHGLKLLPRDLARLAANDKQGSLIAAA